MLLFLCVHWACVISTHGGVCVFLSGGDSWLSLPPVTKRLWLLECDQPLARLPDLHPPLLPPPLQPGLPCYFACGPLSLSLDLHCIWAWSAMETCSAQLEAAASWASPPFFHPSSLALPRPPLFFSSGFMLQHHPTIRASLTPIIMPSWWAHCPRCLDGNSDFRLVSSLWTPCTHIHAIAMKHTKTDRCTHARCGEGFTVSPARCCVFVSGLTSWFGPNDWRK